MKILVVSNNYPSSYRPNLGVFLYNIVQEFCKQGNDVTVIAPQHIVPHKIRFQRVSYGIERAKVYRPWFTSLPARKIGRFNTYFIAKALQVRGIRRIVRKKRLRFDVIYCHFIKDTLMAVEALRDQNTPFIAAVGESDGIAHLIDLYGPTNFRSLLGCVSGFVAVSEMLAAELGGYGIEEKNITIEPNATDLQKFAPRTADEKSAVREKYGFPPDKFTLVFIGHFIERKGPLRVMEAVASLDQVQVIFVGEGRQVPQGRQVIFRGRCPHHVVSDLLSAADAFILPTLGEGANNSIIEAMASGLPIISSDIPEVRAQCTPDFALLVDPLDPAALKRAVETLMKDPERRKAMAACAVAYSRRFDIRERAGRISRFIRKYCKMENHSVAGGGRNDLL